MSRGGTEGAGPKAECTALVIRHVAFEDLGLLGPLLTDLGYGIRYLDAGVDSLNEAAMLNADLVVVLGGPIGVNDAARYPFLLPEMRAIAARLERGRPTLGICLGAQLMAAALGASVTPTGRVEIGYAPLALTESGRQSALGLLAGTPVLHWHGDAFEIPQGTVRLAETPGYPNQAFAGPNLLGLQFHLEADHTRIERWLVGHAHELASHGIDPAVIRADAQLHGPELAARARSIFTTWLTHLTRQPRAVDPPGGTGRRQPKPVGEDVAMRILIAPDKFAGTLTAVEAAAAIEEGWRRRDPEAQVLVAPMADGGPGFIDVLSAVVDGKLLSVTVRGPLGEETPATVLLAGETAYVETAQACGLHLVEPKQRRPEDATTYGVGQLITAAVDAGARRIVLGLGGSGTNDAGAGLLAALGATAEGGALDAGAAGLADVTSVDLAPALERVAGVEFVAASDVENPMLGLRGATNVFGTQKGITDERKPVVDGWLTHFAELAGRKTADQKGAGAAGGLGYALLLLGAERVSGIDLVAELTGLRQKASQVDLVLSGEGAFDFQSRDGKVIAGVAKVANDAMRPCVVLAGKVLIGSREMRSMGVESAYALVDAVGEERAFADPHGSLAAVAERVARTWAR